MGRGRDSRSKSRRRRDSRSRSRGGRGGKGGGKGTGSSVLVRNLSEKTSPDDIRKEFSKCGKIRDVYLPLEYGSRRPKGFGFVEFWEYDDAQYAVREMHNVSLDGSQLTVMIAQDRRKSADQMQRKERGVRRGSPPRDDWDGGRHHWTNDLNLREAPKKSGSRSRGRRGGSRPRRENRDRSRSRSRNKSRSRSRSKSRNRSFSRRRSRSRSRS